MLNFVAVNFHVICLSLLALMIVIRVIRDGSREAKAQAAAQQAECERTEARAAAKRRAEQQREAAQAERQRKAAVRENIRQAKQAARLAEAREFAELKERALNAEKALRALDSQPIEAQDADESTFDDDGILTLTPDEFAERLEALYAAPKVRPLFAGETISFTGTIPGVTRREAIRQTQQAGGTAYPHINTRCTMLVVGEGAECNHSLDAADRWNVRKITWQTWKQYIETAAAQCNAA